MLGNLPQKLHFFPAGISKRASRFFTSEVPGFHREWLTRPRGGSFHSPFLVKDLGMGPKGGHMGEEEHPFPSSS